MNFSDWNYWTNNAIDKLALRSCGEVLLVEQTNKQNLGDSPGLFTRGEISRHLKMSLLLILNKFYPFLCWVVYWLCVCYFPNLVITSWADRCSKLTITVLHLCPECVLRACSVYLLKELSNISEINLFSKD